ncbi:MAG TPA: hypothetical protein PKO18_08160, partial [Chitinophagales bacterium]|nr:hypothetical protein [Chitinophagales bacterium]
MRSTPSPTIISLLGSLAVASSSTALFLIIATVFRLNYAVASIFVFCTIGFFISFIVFRFVLIRYIYNKIRIIYKTIGKPLKFEQEIKEGSGLMVKTVERDVAEWALNKNKRIRELQKLEQYRKEFVG